MKKATLKDISSYLDKAYSTVETWSRTQPKLKEIALLGMTCKKNKIDMKKLLDLIILLENFEKNKRC